MIIVKGYGSMGIPREMGTERVIDLDIDVPDTHDIVGIIRTDFDPEADGSVRSSDELTPSVRYERINDIVGKLLTLADASFSDKEQRKAFKDLLKQIPWDWYEAQREGMVEAWRLDKFPRYKNAFHIDEDLHKTSDSNKSQSSVNS